MENTCCAPSIPYCLTQGAGFYETIDWEDPETDDPIDLTGYTAKMQIRSSPSSSEVVLELSTENGRILNSGATGILTLLVDAEDTADLPAPFVGVYSLLVTNPDGFVTNLLTGVFNINEAITK